MSDHLVSNFPVTLVILSSLVGGNMSDVYGFTVHFLANLRDRSHLLSLNVFSPQLFSAF